MLIVTVLAVVILWLGLEGGRKAVKYFAAPEIKPFSVFVCAQGAMGIQDGASKFTGLPEGTLAPVVFVEAQEGESTGCVLLGFGYDKVEKRWVAVPYYGIKP